jgi:hypothetical protein
MRLDAASPLTAACLFSPYFSKVTNGTVAYLISPPTHYTVATTVRGVDGFFSSRARHTLGDGSLSERDDDGTGVLTSAVRSSWSFASALAGVLTPSSLVSTAG